MSEDRYDRASGINAQFTEREKTVKMGREPVADNARLRSGTPTADDLWTALADLLSANADGKDAEVYWSALQRARDVRDRYRRTIEVAAPVSKRVERLETVEPKTLDEWSEDDGDVVWWCWRDDTWLGEAAYIGTPLDLGRGYALTIGDHEFVVNLGGWPGYHTHWTPHPTRPQALQGGRS